MARTPQQIKNKIKLDRWWNKQKKRFKLPRELEFEFVLILLIGIIFVIGVNFI